MTLDIERLAAVAAERQKQPVLRLKTLRNNEIQRDAYYRNLNEKLKADYLNNMAIRSGAIPQARVPVIRLKSPVCKETKIKALNNIFSNIIK